MTEKAMPDSRPDDAALSSLQAALERLEKAEAAHSSALRELKEARMEYETAFIRAWAALQEQDLGIFSALARSLQSQPRPKTTGLEYINNLKSSLESIFQIYQGLEDVKHLLKQLDELFGARKRSQPGPGAGGGVA